ncbi:MAG: N-acetylmuramoyl-L-alanine amidase [Eubacterium sp.]|nr:N-acetylmuramoyl-L-alanine amidase [Eubacterium sp.]
MKKLLLIIIIISLGADFSSCQRELNEKTSAQNSLYSSKCTVVIDAGHGGKDNGTQGVDGTPEKDINLSISLALYDYFRVCGINSVLIRNGDYEFYKNVEKRTRSDLYNRLDFINTFENGVLISIHQNHFEEESQWGTQIWYSANNPESKIMADSILSTVKEYLQPDNKRNNKVSGDNYYLLYKAIKPSIMVECGFMSNKKENERLKQSEYQKDMAFCIMSSICNIV